MKFEFSDERDCGNIEEILPVNQDICKKQAAKIHFQRVDSNEIHEKKY